MRIALDAMGSDDCPEPELKAAIQAANTFGEPIYLIGPQEVLRPRLAELGGSETLIQIVDAPEVITMEDKGLKLALKAKRKNSKTSMAIGMDLVQDGKADAFVTAGNTGGAMATAYFRLGMISGAERAALTALVPTKTGFCTILDIGANPDLKPEHLVQFAVMGSVFASVMRGIANPRVGLLSNGEEAGKGNELVKCTYPLLEASGLNFVGNVEGKELFGGAADVVVMDGFTGNVLLKASEAVAKLIKDTLSEEIKGSKNPRVLLGGMLLKPFLKEALQKKLEPDEIGAALLLGIDGLVYIGHGRSNAHAMFSAICTARQAVQSKLLSALEGAIQARLAELETKEETK